MYVLEIIKMIMIGSLLAFTYIVLENVYIKLNLFQL